MSHLSARSRLTFLLGLSLGAQSAQVVTTLLVGRFALNGLSLTEVSFWYLVAGAMPFIIVFDFGIGQTAAREVAFARASLEPDHAINDLARTALSLLGISAAALTGLGIFAGSAALMLGPVTQDHLFCIVVFGLGTVIKLLANGTQGLLIGLERLATERLIRTGGSILFCVCAWFFLRMDGGVIGLSSAWLVQAVFCMVASYVAVHRGGISLATGRWRADIAHKLREPIVQYFLSALPGLFIFNLALYVVANALGPSSVVSLSLMLQIYSGMNLIAALPASTLTAFWSSAWARVRLDELCNSVNLGFSLVSLALSAVVAVFAMHSGLAAEVLFGKRALTPPIFVWLYLVLGLTEGLTNCLTAAALATGFVRFAGITWASSLGVLMLTWPLTHSFGLLGVPLAVLISQAFTCYQRNVRVTARRLRLDRHRIWRLVLLAVVPLGVQLLAQALSVQSLRSVELAPVIRLVVHCAVAGITAAGMLAVLQVRGMFARPTSDALS